MQNYNTLQYTLQDIPQPNYLLKMSFSDFDSDSETYDMWRDLAERGRKDYETRTTNTTTNTTVNAPQSHKKVRLTFVNSRISALSAATNKTAVDTALLQQFLRERNTLEQELNNENQSR